MCSINEVEDGLKIADEKRQSTAKYDILLWMAYVSFFWYYQL